MRLEDLLVALAPRIDVHGAHAQFRATDGGGAGEAERFLSWLRARDFVDGALLTELHAADAIEVQRLVSIKPDRTLVFAAPDAATLAAGRASTAPPTPSPDGSRYQLLGRLGAGAMGEVHVARDVDLRRKVALKRMMPAVAQSQPLAARFFAEIQVTAQLDHPNIVPIYNLEIAPDGTLAYSMKLVQGRTLSAILDEGRQALARDGKKRERERMLARLDIFLRVCDAMAYAHAKGVLHRDLKPDNIMVGRYNEVYVMDWGICRVIGTHEEDAGVTQSGALQTQYGALLGTPAYMSPEQALGKNPELDARSDQFALGLILQELATLRPPRAPGEIMAVLARAAEGARVPMAHLEPRVRIGPELRAIVKKACAPAPGARYQTVGALADDVRRFIAGNAVSARRDNPLQRAGRFLGRHRVGSALTMLALLLAGAAGIISMLALEQTALGRAHLHERRLQRFLGQVAGQSHALDVAFGDYEEAIDALAGRAAEVLTRATPAAQRVLTPADFDHPGRAPLLSAAQRYRGPVSFDEPVFQIAPGVRAADVANDIGRLALLRPAFRRTMLSSAIAGGAELTPAMEDALLTGSAVPLSRVFVTLDSGVHASFPGQGGFPATYDGRARPKYRLAAHQRGIRWGSPYVDPLGAGALLPGSTSIYDDRGRFLGVAGVGVTFRYLIDRLLAPRDRRGIASSFLVDDQGRVVVHSGAGEEDVAAGAAEDGSMRLPPLPWPEVAAAARKHQSGFIERDGHVIAYGALATLGWTYVVDARVAALPGGAD